MKKPNRPIFPAALRAYVEEGMTPLPRITVITPSFNQAPFLEATIRSVLDQGYPHLQYGVVDGGSTDGSVEIIERYRDRLDFAIIEPDNGQVDALNKGLRRATGEIACYINSDDTLLPGCLFTVGAFFMGHRTAGWLIGNCALIDAEGEQFGVVHSAPAEDLAHALIRDKPFNMPQPGIFWRRGLLEQHGLFREDLAYCFDYEMWCRFLLHGVQPHLINATLATYRFHDASKTVSTQHGFLREHIEIERQYAAYLPLRHRIRLTRGIGYRVRQHLVATATSRPWGVIARRPWWIGSQQVRNLLIHGPTVHAA